MKTILNRRELENILIPILREKLDISIEKITWNLDYDEEDGRLHLMSLTITHKGD